MFLFFPVFKTTSVEPGNTQSHAYDLVHVYAGLHVVYTSEFQLLYVSLVYEYSIFNFTTDRHLGNLQYGAVWN